MRSQLIKVSVSDAEHKAFNDYAREMSLPLSDLVRRLLDVQANAVSAHITPPPPSPQPCRSRPTADNAGSGSKSPKRKKTAFTMPSPATTPASPPATTSAASYRTRSSRCSPP